MAGLSSLGRAGIVVNTMRLAEHENEGDNEEFITEIVVDVQDPAAPIFEAPRLGEGSHDTRCVTATV